MILYNLRFELFLILCSLQSQSLSRKRNIFIIFIKSFFELPLYIWNWIDYYATLNLRRLENKWIEEESKILEGNRRSYNRDWKFELEIVFARRNTNAFCGECRRNTDIYGAAIGPGVRRRTIRFRRYLACDKSRWRPISSRLLLTSPLTEDRSFFVLLPRFAIRWFCYARRHRPLLVLNSSDGMNWWNIRFVYSNLYIKG